MAVKDDILTAIQAVADASENLDLKRSLGDPDGAEFELRNQTVSPGIAYTIPGFLDSVIEGIASAVSSNDMILVFGSDTLEDDIYLRPGYTTSNSAEIAVPIIGSWTLTGVRVRLLTAPGVSNSCSVTISKNGTPNIATKVTLTGNDTDEAISTSLSFSDGQRVSVLYEESGESVLAAHAVVSLYFTKN